MAKHLDVEDINASGELVTRALRIDTDPNSNTDFECFIDDVNGVRVRKALVDLFSVDPETGDAHFSGDLDCGPLFLSNARSADPVTYTFTMYSFIRTIVLAIKNGSNIWVGKFPCSGSFNGHILGAFRISYVFTHHDAETYRQVTGTYFGSPPVLIGYIGQDWVSTPWDEESYALEFFDTNMNSLSRQILTGYKRDAKTWSQSGSVYSLSQGPITPAPSDESGSPGLETMQGPGSIVLNLSAATFRLSNLPVGATPGSVYIDNNGFLKVVQ